MGRLLEARYRITGTLKCEAPIHVGGAGDDLVLDMPLARDGADKLYLPGTSLAGPIRAWWAQAFGENEMKALFGKMAESATDEGHGSYVLIEDAVEVSKSLPEIRDGVGIDRVTGAAADGIKYDREIVPKGAAFDFEMTVEVPVEYPMNVKRVEDLENNLCALVHALHRGDIRFGGAKTRSHGKLRLDAPEMRKHVMNTADGIRAMLSAKTAKGVAVDWKAVPARKRHTLAIAIHWRPELPVMVKAGADGFLVDHLPMVTADGAQLKPVIPGSAIKGALRSHAERIWRTVKNIDIPKDQEFAGQLSGATLADRLFGSIAGRKADGEKDRAAGSGDAAGEGEEAAKDTRGLGAVTVDDCHIGDDITRGLWNELLTKTADEKVRLNEVRMLVEEVKLGPNNALPVAHVAIDRWTGGAADSRLFSALEWKVDRSFTIEITIDPKRVEKKTRDAEPALLESETRDAALALLVLTLRDFAKGRIPLGYGVNRGLGSVTVEKIEIADETGTLLKDRTQVELESFDDLSALQHLDDAWRKACKEAA